MVISELNTSTDGAGAPSTVTEPEHRGRDDRAGGEAVLHFGSVVQPNEFLVGVELSTLTVAVVSENLETHLGIRPADALGCALADLLGAAVVGQLPVSGPLDPRTEARIIRLPRPATATGPLPPAGTTDLWNSYYVTAQRTGGLRILKFELLEDDSGGELLTDGFARSLADLTIDGVPALCAAAAAEVPTLTGFDRVFIVRIRGDRSADIVAESVDADRGGVLGTSWDADGMRVPLAYYAEFSTRVVADVDADLVGLVCSVRALPHGVGASSRAWVEQPYSEAELEMLRSLGARASMTLALTVDGVLWGLLVCQHRTPRRVSGQLRDFCEMLGRILSLQIHAVDVRLDQRLRQHLAGLVAEVVAAMSAGRTLEAGAAAASEALLAMVDADGVVLEVEGRRITAGRTPAVRELEGVLARLAVGTDDELAGGLTGSALYRRLGSPAFGCVLWLRDARGRAAVRTANRPWLPAERAAADSLARAVPDLMLQHLHRVLIEAQLAVAEERVQTLDARHRLEHQLHQQQRLESLGQLAGGVAHDFNNLLTVIRSYAEFVEDEIDTAARAVGGDRWSAAQEDIRHVKDATVRAADLTQRLLAFARREVVEARALDLNGVISGLEHLLQRTIGGQVALTVDLEPGLGSVLADPGQIERLLVNLAVNARDAMPAGGTLTISTRTVDRRPPEPPAETGPAAVPAATGDQARTQVLVRVTDTGTGIPPEILDRIYEPFFTTKAARDGTGLGLATVYGIVSQLGATIAIESEVGHGTAFTVALPTTDLTPERVVAPAAPEPVGGGETVLIVEDGDDLRELTSRVLTRSGYDVLAASNGGDAIEAAARHGTPIDLLLTDMMMPMMTGTEVARRIRELYPAVRVLVMSGYAGPAHGVGGGLTLDYPLLTKPFSRSALLSAIESVLHRGEPPKGIEPLTYALRERRSAD